MIVFPAIDIQKGLVVRLRQGVENDSVTYFEDPVKTAVKWYEEGAAYLHVVDLDGAFAGTPQNGVIIRQICEAVPIPVEVGGGIRDEARIKEYLSLGVDRFILGSAALKNPDFVRGMAKLYRIVVGIDAKEGLVATEGWAERSRVRATDLARDYADAGVCAIICTDISRDGMLSGVNVEFSRSSAKACGIDTIASGGVKDMNDIITLKNAGSIAGLIVGKAYYEGTLDLRKAFEAL